MANIILCVGYPGCGKTTYSHKHYKKYTILDGDSLKTSDRVVRSLKRAIERNESVVVDATNVTRKRRDPIMNLAKEKNVPVICLWFSDSMETCMERAKKRFEDGGKKIPRIAFYTLRKNFEKPDIEEGFKEIISIANFISSSWSKTTNDEKGPDWVSGEEFAAEDKDSNLKEKP